jgi:hypothetical protein
MGNLVLEADTKCFSGSGKTRKARLKRAKSALNDFCRSHRHEPVKQQQASLCSNT